jgi:hypothetical protein
VDFVPHYAAQFRLSIIFGRKKTKNIKARRQGYNFSTGFWSPPLTAQEVFNLEQNQINQTGLTLWFRFPTTTALTRT